MPGDIQKGRSVLHIITRLDKGGSAEVLLDLARIQADNGYRVGIAVGKTNDPQTDLDKYSEAANVSLYHVPPLLRRPSPVNDLKALLALIRIVRRFSPDIVHTHTSKAGIIGRFAAYLSGVRRIVHTPHGHIFYGYYSPAVTRVFILIERLAAGITGKITVLTNKGLNDHLDEKIGRASLFTVIPSGVKLERFRSGSGDAVRSVLDVPDTQPLVGWVGRLTAIKDCKTFITAAALIHAEMPDVRFLIAGDGEERDALVEKAKQLGVYEYLVFLGNRDDIPDIMAALDIFVLSSVNEGFGRVLVEAMAAGAAVVSTDVGGTADVIENGVSGILVPPSNPELLADAVVSLFRDRNTLGRLSAEGRKRANLYDVYHTAERFGEVYDELFED